MTIPGNSAIAIDRPWPSTFGLIATQIRGQLRTFWRTPISAFFTIAFPLIVLVLFGLIFGNETFESPFGPITSRQFYAPALGAFSAVSATYTNLAITTTIRRDEGVLKRVRSTPLPPAIWMGGAIGAAVILALLGVLLSLTVGVVFYGVDIDLAKMPAAVVTFVVGTTSFAALGLALSALAKSGQAAPALTNATLLPLAMISNVFVPIRDDAPAWLSTVANIFPLRPFVDAFSTAFAPTTSAPAFVWSKLAIVAAWGVLGLIVALRKFTWEPVGPARRSRQSSVTDA